MAAIHRNTHNPYAQSDPDRNGAFLAEQRRQFAERLGPTAAERQLAELRAQLGPIEGAKEHVRRLHGRKGADLLAGWF